MKILEILREEQWVVDEDSEDEYTPYQRPQVDIPHRDTKSYSVDTMRRGTHAKHGTLGSGSQATAHPHPKDPTKIIKYVDLWKSNPANDPHVQWIDLASKHQDNPFFPRIFNTKTVRHQDTNKVTLIVVMEKLHPIADMWNASEKLGDAANQMINRLGIDVKDAAGDGYGLAIYMSSSERRKELRNKTKNPQFKEALTVLEPLFRKHGTDLHNENVMVRLTGVGPQLVFVDPLQLPDVDPDQVGI